MKNILFLCVANSARSQIAEGLAREIFKDVAQIFSAGSAPVSVNPYAIKVMTEVGIDLAAHSSKSIADINVDMMDIIITLCADEICPAVPARATHFHWPLSDPASDNPHLTPADLTARFRNTRDEINARLTELDLSAP